MIKTQDVEEVLRKVLTEGGPSDVTFGPILTEKIVKRVREELNLRSLSRFDS